MDSLLELWPDDDRRDDAMQRLLERVLAGRAHKQPGEPDLTDKQRRYLFAASLGLEARDSAALFGVSADTVSASLTRARRVLAAKNTTHAVATAIRCHIIP